MSNTGGPAFPRNILDHGHGVTTTHESGMTLRDYFAAHASEEDIKYWQPTGQMVERVAVTSSGKVVYQEAGKYTREQARYFHADAMLRAREQK